MKKIFIVAVCLFFVYNAGFCNYDVHKLKNGQIVVIQEIHDNPIVTIDTWIKTGSINETNKNNGISHFLEHLFFKGSANFKTGEFDKILESKGAISNAATSKDFTHYYITIPSKNFDLALKLHSDMLLNPTIPQDEMEKERLVVLEEIAKDINSPHSKLYNNLIEMLYTTHPYKQKVIGEPDIIKNITRGEILEYFNTYYTPTNMVTVIVGDIDGESALKKIDNLYNVKYKKSPTPKYVKEKRLPSLCRKIEYLPTETGYILIGFRGVKITDKDSYALDTLATILGDGKSSLLYQEIKDKKSLAFDVSAQNGTYKDDGIFFISAEFIPQNYKHLEENIFLQIADIQKNGIKEEQLSLAKNIIRDDTYYLRESTANIAQEIGYTTTVSGNTKFYDEYLKNIDNVTTNDIKRVANKYININNAAISLILPKEYKNKELKNTDKKQDNSNSAQFINKNNGIEKYKLANGGILLYNKNTSNNIVGINILFKGGEFYENIAGTGKLTAATMTTGTKKYTTTELANILEFNGIKIVPNSSADTFSIDILTTVPKYKKTMELLSEIINNPTFDEKEIKKIQNNKINEIKSMRDIPFKKALEEHNTNIYSGSVYSNSTKILEKTYPKITHKDIVNYYNKIINPNDMIISINGNINKKDVIKSFENIFTSKKQNNFDYTKYTVPIVKYKRISEIIDKNTETDWIILAWQTDGIKNTKDYATLSVIDSFLGTGMSSRLFVNLRDKEGLAYQLGSSYKANINKGSIIFFMGTNPKNLNLAKSKMFYEINNIKKEPISDIELQEAKDKLIGHYIISQETNIAKATTAGWFEFCEKGYDFDFIKEVEKVTKNDIMNAANKYFNNNYVLSIVKK